MKPLKLSVCVPPGQIRIFLMIVLDAVPYRKMVLIQDLQDYFDMTGNVLVSLGLLSLGKRRLRVGILLTSINT